MAISWSWAWAGGPVWRWQEGWAKEAADRADAPGTTKAVMVEGTSALSVKSVGPAASQPGLSRSTDEQRTIGDRRASFR